MGKYKRIILLALFFSFIGVGFSNGLLFKKNKLVEEVIEYDEIVRKVKKSHRKPASIHSAKRAKTRPSVVADTFQPDLAKNLVEGVDENINEADSSASLANPSAVQDSSSEKVTYLSGANQGTQSSPYVPQGTLPNRAVAGANTINPSQFGAAVSGDLGPTYAFSNTNFNKPTTNATSIYKVKSITFKDGAFIIKGENLNTVRKITLNSSGTTSELEKISSTSSQVMAMGFNALKLIAGKTYSLIIADAYGSSSYPISVELADGSVTPRKLAPLGASEDGYILKWDASSQSWIAAPDEVGAGPDGGITSITKGAGIVGQGTSITTVGSIAVDVGSDAGQIPQFNADKKLVLQSDNRMSFTENAEEFVLGMFSEVFKLRNQTNDTDIFSVVGNDFLVRGQQVCLSDGTNCPAAGAAVESVSVSAPLTMSGTTNVSLGLGIDNTTIGLNGSSQLSIPNAAITANKLNQMGATPGQVLKWNGATWAPAVDTDTGITTEADPLVRNFARTDASAPASCNQDETWVHDVILDAFVCRDIQITSGQVTGLNLHWETATGGINFAGGSLGIGTNAPGNTAVKPFHKLVDLASTTDNHILGYSMRINEGGNNRRVGFFLDDASGTYGLDSTASTVLAEFVLQVAGAEKFRLANTGNIGIGTSTPRNELEVVGSGQPRIAIRTLNESTSESTELGFQVGTATNSSTNTTALIRSTITQADPLALKGDLRFLTNSGDVAAERMIITDSGNVGIGTSTPSSKLEVAGVIKATGFEGPMTSTSVSTGTGSAAAPAYSFSNSTSTGLFSSTAGVIGVSSGGSHTFSFTSSGFSSQTTGGGSLSSSAGSAVAPTFSFAGDEDTGWFRPMADTLAAATGGAERMRINSSGNVGIGSTSPGEKLEVSGGIKVGTFAAGPISGTADARIGRASDSTQGEFVVQLGASNTNFRVVDHMWNRTVASINSNAPAASFFLNSTGNIGLGTNSPGRVIDIHRTDVGALVGITNLDSTANRYPGVEIVNHIGTATNGNPEISLRNRRGSSTASLPLQMNDVLGQFSFIGRGDTGDRFGAKLTVFADENFTNSSSPASLVFSTTNPGSTNTTEKMRINSRGHVGIGVLAPSEKLEVAGTVYSIGANSVADLAGDSAYYGGGKQHGYNVYGPVGGDGAPYTYGATNTTTTAYKGGKAGARFQGGNGSNYAGGGAGVFAQGGDGANNSASTQGGAGIYARGGINGDGSRTFAGYFAGDVTATGVIKASSFVGPMTSTSVSSGTGSAATPTYSFSNSASTGLFSSTAGTIGVSSGGTHTFNFTGSGISSASAGGATLASGAGSAATPTFSFSGDEDTGWYSPLANTLAAATGGQERLRIVSNGYVGIGTSSPQSPLDISANFAQSLSLRGGTADHVYLSFFARSSDVYARSGYLGFPSLGSNQLNLSNEFDNVGSINLVTKTAGSSLSRLTVANNGYIGIGTINPMYQLDVLAQNSDAAIRTINYTTTVNSGGTFIGARARGTASAPTHPLAGDLMAQFLGKNAISDVTHPGMVIWASENHNATNLGDYINFYTTADGTITSTEKMRITGDGKVGIGTINPNSKLSLDIGTSPSTPGMTISGGATVNQQTHLLLHDGGTSGANRIDVDFAFWNTTPNARISSLQRGVSSANGASLVLETSSDNAGTFNANQMTLENNGNIGIGKSGAIAKLDVASAGNTLTSYTARFQSSPSVNGGGGIVFDQNSTYGYKMHSQGTSAASGSLYFNYINLADGSSVHDNVLVLRNGNIGVGTDSPGTKFHVHGPIRVSGSSVMESTFAGDNWTMKNIYTGAGWARNLLRFTDNVGTEYFNYGAVGSGQSFSYGFIGQNYNNNAIKWGANNYVAFGGSTMAAPVHPFLIGTNSFVVTAGDNVGIGTTTPSEKLHVAGNILATGTITPSDIRLKKNFEPVENALDKINGLSAVTYDWKDQGKFSSRRQMGVIAQEVEKAFPEAVTKTNDGFLAVSYTSLISPLIAAVKELYTMVIELFEGQKEINRTIASKADQVEIDEIKMQNEKLAEENKKIKEENQALKARLDKIEKALGL